MNSKNIIIVFILSITGIILFLSTMYDKKINASKIAIFQCETNPHVIFPTEYLTPAKQAEFLPNEVYHTQMQKVRQAYKLNWKSAGLTGLPEHFFKDYQCIQHLHLSNNHFSEIPIAIQDLNNLQSISLAHNQIISFNHKDIDYTKFNDLRLIDFSHNLIDTIDYIPLMNSSIRLDLSHNKIKHINHFNSFLYFDFLNLSYNQLEECPNSLLKLNNVWELNLSNNKINGTFVLHALRKLKILNVSNQTNSDSSKIEKLIIDDCGHNIKELYASNNHIKEFDSILRTSKTSYLRNLEIADFSHNRLTSFPYLLYNNRSLKELDLSHNKIASLSVERNLDELHLLNLSHNNITYIENMRSLVNLGDIDLSHNQLTEFPLFTHNPSLSTLNLSHNNINSLDNFLLNKETNNSFETIDLSHNKIKYLEKSLISMLYLKELNLSHNEIKVFHVNFYDNLANLNLSNNLLEEILCPISLFFRLETLDLSNNPNLKSFPIELLSGSPELYRVYIKNTNFDEEFLVFLISYCKHNDIELIQ